MVLNLLGQLLPTITAVVSIPIALHGLGVQRFSVLSIAWVLLAYLTVFDLGMGRASIRFLASALAERRLERVAMIVWTTVAVELVMGVVAGGLLAVASPFLVTHFLKVDSALRSETATSFFLLAAMVPFLLTLNGLRGVLEANQRFDLVNLVRTLSSSVLFGMPALGALWHWDLPTILFWMATSLAGTTLTYLLFALRVCPGLMRMPVIEPALLLRIFRFGGWVTVSGIVAPLIAFSDRLLITGFASVGGLAYYSIPYEVTARMQIVPTSFGSVLYPAFSAMGFQGEGNAETSRLYARSIKYLLLIMAPLMLLVALCAHTILAIWIDPVFAVTSAPIMQWLALGVLLNSLAFVPIQLLDAHDRPKVRAIVFLVELGLYVPLAALLIARLGLTGAAISFALRGLFEVAVFFLLAWPVSGLRNSISQGANGLIRASLVCLLLSIPSVALVRLLSNLQQGQQVLVALVVPVVALLLWRFALDADERQRFRDLFRRLIKVGEFR
jgi:O-antigen/teichoic acid export membrane protein